MFTSYSSCFFRLHVLEDALLSPPALESNFIIFSIFFSMGGLLCSSNKFEENTLIWMLAKYFMYLTLYIDEADIKVNIFYPQVVAKSMWRELKWSPSDKSVFFSGVQTWTVQNKQHMAVYSLSLPPPPSLLLTRWYDLLLSSRVIAPPCSTQYSVRGRITHGQALAWWKKGQQQRIKTDDLRGRA